MYATNCLSIANCLLKLCLSPSPSPLSPSLFFSIALYCIYSAPLSCGSPDSQQNTTIIGRNYTLGNTIIYECPKGHSLLGGAERTCRADGTWSGRAPTCKCECAQIQMFHKLKYILITNTIPAYIQPHSPQMSIAVRWRNWSMAPFYCRSNAPAMACRRPTLATRTTRSLAMRIALAS